MTVLGKRLRSSDADDPLLSLPARTKRRTRSSLKHNQDFEIHEDAHDPQNNSLSTVQRSTTSKSKPLTPSPSKGNARVSASPSKPHGKRYPDANDESLPRTPRHRDAASHKEFATPRHRVTMTGMPRSPCTPKTPSDGSHPQGSKRSIFTDARKLFARSSNADCLIGREMEREELSTFITNSVQTCTSGCLYVSGPPGTGKSAFVANVCDEYDTHSTVKYAYLNCMSVKSAAEVYSHLVSKLGITDDVFGPLAKDQLSIAISSKDNTDCFLVVLDEIDQMLELDMSALYSLFEWSLTPTSRLILVGIANALDLTDRFLPELKARHLKPRLLPFLPNSATEIASVISTRARSLIPTSASTPADFIPLLTSQAVQLISKKIAAQSGDLRKAFDITHKIIDMLETEADERLKTASRESPSRIPLSPRPETLSPSRVEGSARASLQSMTYETAPRATLSHVLRITNAAFTANSTASRLKTLNLQQRAVLCSMTALETRNQQRLKRQQEQESEHHALPSPADTPTSKRMKAACQAASKSQASIPQAAPTVREVYEAYSRLCKTEHLLHALSFSEFRDVVSNLETAGLVSGVDGRGSLIQVAPSTPSRKGRGSAAPALSVRVDDCRIKGTASAAELERSLEGAGCDVLRRMLAGEGF